MAKQKDKGDLLEIFYDKDRDSLRKFQKLIRKAITLEKKNITIHMPEAPLVSQDFLASLVLGTKALKSYGYKVNFYLSPQNYATLQTSEHSKHFLLEMVGEKKDVTPSVKEALPSIPEFFTLQDNTISVEDEGVDQIPEVLGKLISGVLKKHSSVILDLTQLFLLTPSVIQSLIIESLNCGNALTVKVLKPMKEVLLSDPQAAILNVITPGEKVSPPEVKLSTLEKKEDQFSLDFDDDYLPPTQPLPVKTIKSKTQALVQQVSSENPLFKVKLNCLIVERMSCEEFIQQVSAELPKLYPCGNQLYIDMSNYGPLSEDIVKKLISLNFEAKEHQKKLGLRLLSDQNEFFLSCLPSTEVVEKKEDDSPRFDIVGSRLEIKNVSPELFIDEFPKYFHKLAAVSQKAITVDISTMKKITDRAIELLVLYYLEAVGKGHSMSVRISPDMEERFLRSGRGRALPLEIVKASVSATLGNQKKSTKGRIDMSKLQKAMETDRLSDKVLNKEYQALHVESRGTMDNWETTNSGNASPYKGVERRKEKRYKAEGLEVAFAKGTLGKIAGRHYQVHNLSHSGACFTSASAFVKSEPLRMKMYKEDKLIFEASAKIIWCTPVPSKALFVVGVQFTKVSEVAKIQLQEVIGELHRKQY